MNLLAAVSTIMATDLITLGPEDNIKKVEDLFLNNNIHHIPIEKGGRLVGMVSKSDYLYFKRGFNENSLEQKWDLFRLKSHTVDEIMTEKLAVMAPDEKINVAIEIFKSNILHAIPIVKSDRLVGLVTTLDIIKHLADDKETVKEYKLN